MQVLFEASGTLAEDSTSKAEGTGETQGDTAPGMLQKVRKSRWQWNPQMVHGQRRLDQGPWVLEGDNVSVCIKVSLKPRLSRGPLGDIWEYLESFSAKQW